MGFYSSSIRAIQEEIDIAVAAKNAVSREYDKCRWWQIVKKVQLTRLYEKYCAAEKKARRFYNTFWG